MTEYIYGDVLFAIDFSMDFLCLYIAGKLTHMKMKTWRVILAAALGALYGVTSLLYSVSAPVEIIIEISAAFAVCAAGIWNGGKRRLLLATALFYAVSALIGGVMTLIYSKLGKYRSYFEIGGNISTALGEVPVWVLVLCAVASAAITKLLSILLKRKNAEKTCDISLTLGGKTYEISGFADGGNGAVDPISGAPVIFLSKRFEGELPSEEVALSGNASGIRAVPISTVNGGGIVFAKRPERLYIKTHGEFEARDALVALGKDETFGGCDALVPLELM